MSTWSLPSSKTPKGQMVVIKGDTAFDGRIVYLVPEGYLEQGYCMVEDTEFGIQFPIRREYLLPL